MKTLTLIFLLLTSPLTLAREPSVKESEVVAFLNENGYTVVSNDEQQVTIHYHEETDSWSVKVNPLCQGELCACIDCEFILHVSGSSGDLKLAILMHG